jgi:hypothetical protein
MEVDQRPDSWTILTKVLRASLLAILSHLYTTALPSDLHFFKLTQPLTVSTVQLQLLYTVKKGGERRKPDRKPYPMVLENHSETSHMRTLKIMPRNLNEIVQYVHEFGFGSIQYHEYVLYFSYLNSTVEQYFHYG